MKLDKDMVRLSFEELDIIAACPWSINNENKIKFEKQCLRCSAFSKLGRFTLQKVFKNSVAPSQKVLTNKYFNILCTEHGFAKYDSGLMSRKDLGILYDILEYVMTNSEAIDVVAPHINLHFGRFILEGTIDGILYMKKENSKAGNYAIIKFQCDQHDNFNQISHSMIAASYWLRTAYHVETNDIVSVSLSRSNNTKIIKWTLHSRADELHKAIETDLNYLSLNGGVEELIKTKSDPIKLGAYLNRLPKRWGNHCIHCMECFK